MHLALSTLLSEGGGLSDLFNVGQSSLLWTIVIFVLSLPLLWKVVFGPITRALDERESKIRQAVAAAEAAREEVAGMKAAIQGDLEKARREAAQRLEEAKARAEVREREILAAAKEQADRDRARAREEIARALASARETLRSEAVTLGVQVAEAVISREFSEADQRRLVEDFRGAMAARN